MDVKLEWNSQYTKYCEAISKDSLIYDYSYNKININTGSDNNLWTGPQPLSGSTTIHLGNNNNYSFKIQCLPEGSQYSQCFIPTGQFSCVCDTNKDGKYDYTYSGRCSDIWFLKESPLGSGVYIRDCDTECSGEGDSYKEFKQCVSNCENNQYSCNTIESKNNVCFSANQTIGLYSATKSNQPQIIAYPDNVLKGATTTISWFNVPSGDYFLTSNPIVPVSAISYNDDISSCTSISSLNDMKGCLDGVKHSYQVVSTNQDTSHIDLSSSRAGSAVVSITQPTTFYLKYIMHRSYTDTKVLFNYLDVIGNQAYIKMSDGFGNQTGTIIEVPANNFTPNPEYQGMDPAYTQDIIGVLEDPTTPDAAKQAAVEKLNNLLANSGYSFSGLVSTGLPPEYGQIGIQVSATYDIDYNTNISAVAVVNILPSTSTSLTLTANPPTIIKGATSTIAYNIINASTSTPCVASSTDDIWKPNISLDNSGKASGSDTLTLNDIKTYNFSLTCYDKDGNPQTAYAQVNVTEGKKYTCDPVKGCVESSSGTYTETQCKSDCKYHCTSANTCDSVYKVDNTLKVCSTTDDCKIPPPVCTVSLDANPKAIVLGKSLTLTWEPTNCTSCTSQTYIKQSDDTYSITDKGGDWQGNPLNIPSTTPSSPLNTSHDTPVKPTAKGTFKYEITCNGNLAGETTTVTKDIDVKVITLPIWREIIPNLGGFLKGLFK
jgi:hypothetical protein